MTYKKGDHLVTNIDVFGAFEHHGLYVGGGNIIHLTAEDKEVIITGEYGFSEGAEIRVKRHAQNPTVAVQRAYASLGKRGYNVISNNCEQFVNYCLNKKKTSNQVSSVTHTATHVAARAVGGTIGRTAASTLGVITIASTGAKYLGEYAGLPDSVNTVVGAPGDLVAKPLEKALTGTFNTVGNTYDHLADGEILDAAGELIGGVAETAIDVVAAPFEVVGDTFSAISSWFD